ncbi:MAG: 4Fe-4S binding protein [Bacteroidota bacterium]
MAENTDNKQYADLLTESKGFRINLFKKFPLLKKFAKLKGFQFILILPSLFIFYIIIISGLIGTPMGNRNIAIVVLWILWWFLLIAILVPLLGRSWCAMCPLPWFGDLFQRMSFFKVRPGKTNYLRNKMFGFNLTWPKRLKNIWLPNINFLILCTFSAILVTRPFVSSFVVGAMLVLATVLAIVFRQRAFCSHVCPVSGFIGLYSKTAMLELRSNDKDVCKNCTDKGCLRGNENGWGCPWFEYMGNLDRNNNCGLCMECVKSCPNDNIALNLRPFATETTLKGYDEAWKGFIDVGTSHAYSLIYLGSSGVLKDWVNPTQSHNWIGFFSYVVILWLFSLLVVPALFFLFTSLSNKLSHTTTVSYKEAFKAYSYILIPLGLLAWIAFSVPLLLVNGSYIVSVISDPLGWGWNLFGTRDFLWHPVIPEYIGFIQIALLLIGLGYAIYKGFFVGQHLYNSATAAFRALLPVAVFSTIIALAFIMLYIG